MKKLSDAIIERDKKVKSFLSINEGESAAHYMEATMGQYGKIVVLEAPAADMLAEILEIPDGWQLTPISQGPNNHSRPDVYVAYNKGDRLTFFEDEKDFDADAK